MSKYGYLSTNFSRTGRLRDIDLRRDGAHLGNVLPEMVKSPQSPTFRLMGEVVSSPAAITAAFDKGPFMYQFHDNGRSLDVDYCRIRYCKGKLDLDRLISRLFAGRAVVLRHLHPDPLPPTPPIYVKSQFGSYW